MKTFLLAFALLFAIILKSQHTIVLTNGDKLNGIVLSLKDDQWKVFIDGKEKEIHMKEISSIFFKEYVPYDGVFIPESDEKVITVDGFTVKYQIKDRELEKEPKVSIGTEDKGTVVVKITVDRYGNIRSAEPGAPGSTTSNKYLYTKAQIAAKTAQFKEDLKGPLITEGTITIVY
ncbi:MAG: hypothetical protein DWP98_08085 [Bacteroidetes bacterium]|nr:MAG: hypothetical protein DWP98_08085 [Bacteroidota bacterium]